MPRAKIIYSGFYDFPLGFVASHEGRRFLFSRGWDESLDDYETDYTVFVLPEMTDEAIQASWPTIHDLAVTPIGTIAVSALDFDPTHRESIATSAFSLIRRDGL